MPSKSPAQARLMRAAAHDPAIAASAGVPQEVARDFVQADRGRKKRLQVLQELYGSTGPARRSV